MVEATGRSPYTFITEKALRILGITDADKAVDDSYKILLQGVTIECRKSFGNFKEVNVLDRCIFQVWGISFVPKRII
uniref:HARE-HTH domain-containing protein n=1 Tax=Panagrellus redivivus TaxID=6233 RepID=A0A7E4VVY2_PANRE